MEKVWLNHYEAGVPATIPQLKYHTLVELFDKSCSTFADLPAYANMGKVLTYKEVDALARDFAAYLTHELQLQKGDRLAIMMPNVLQYPIVMFGAFRAGLIVVNINPLYTPRELIYPLNDAEVKAIVVLENMAHVLEEALPKTNVAHVITTKIGDMLDFPKSVIVNCVVKYIKKKCPNFSLPQAIPFKKILSVGRNLPFTPVPVTTHDVAYLQYTGGTTGVAKGAVLTHCNMVSNLTQARLWIDAHVVEGKEIIITALPLYHIFSLTANCLVFMSLGALNVLITNPRDIAGFIKELKQYRFSAITGVNTLFNALLHHHDFGTVDFSALKFTLGGGMAVQRVVAERWKQLTGSTLLEAYGLTETSPAVTINPFNLAEYSGSIGLPLSSTEIKVIDENGTELDLNQPGELCVRGPQVMQGYWHRPEETQKVLSADGWFKTGDIATVDERGFVRIVDRKKDMILVSGFNVYPNEIEDVVATHPGVLEVAAIGVSDPHSGEVVKLFVVRRDPELTKETLLNYCRAELAGYKMPKHIEFRTELPKTPVGKILRRALRDEPVVA